MLVSVIPLEPLNFPFEMLNLCAKFSAWVFALFRVGPDVLSLGGSLGM